MCHAHMLEILQHLSQLVEHVLDESGVLGHFFVDVEERALLAGLEDEVKCGLLWADDIPFELDDGGVVQSLQDVCRPDQFYVFL